jgi:hypothetical protein
MGTQEASVCIEPQVLAGHDGQDIESGAGVRCGRAALEKPRILFRKPIDEI